MKVKQGLKTVYNKPMNRENASGKYCRENCRKDKIGACIWLWWWYNLTNVRQKGKGYQKMVVIKGETKQGVWVVMTEVNDYKNIFCVCATQEKAVEVKRQAVEADKWDYVYILAMPVYE